MSTLSDQPVNKRTNAAPAPAPSPSGYDWMGVVDTLRATAGAASAAAAAVPVAREGSIPLTNSHTYATTTAAARGPAAGDTPGPRDLTEVSEVAAAAAMAVALADAGPSHGLAAVAAAAAAADPQGEQRRRHREHQLQQQRQREDLRRQTTATAVPTAHAPAAREWGAPPPPGGTRLAVPPRAPADDDAGSAAAAAPHSQKTALRVARKRTREKQRRSDTNSQFTALADIVREIEGTDFAEEARLRLEEPYGDGAAGAAAGGPAGGPAARLKSDVPVPPAPAFNPANRVDLIARTIGQLTRFRLLRRRRTEEVRDARREVCALRKECEGLRRALAHHKLAGMGERPPEPEKVMMMVPMMVPQDAVGQIAGGYPAAHQYATPQWMGGAEAASLTPHHHPGLANGLANGLPNGLPNELTNTGVPGAQWPHHLQPGQLPETRGPAPGVPSPQALAGGPRALPPPRPPGAEGVPARPPGVGVAAPPTGAAPPRPYAPPVAHTMPAPPLRGAAPYPPAPYAAPPTAFGGLPPAYLSRPPGLAPAPSPPGRPHGGDGGPRAPDRAPASDLPQALPGGGSNLAHCA